MVLPLSASRSRAALGAVLGLVLLTATACGNTPSTVDAPDGGTLLRSDVAQAPADDSTDLTAATAGLRDLGLALSTHLPADTGEAGNQVFSPASLAIAFAMLREGAGPAAGDEIDRVIGLPENRQAAYNRIVHDLTDVGKGDVLAINDALFLDPGYAVKRTYLDTIAQWYGAGVQQTGFPHPALEDINGWVKSKTHGRIPQLLQDLDPQAVLALVNTIYLNAKWQTPFSASETHDAEFTTGDGSTVTAKAMHNQTDLDLAQGDGWRAVRLPYAGGKLSMWVLLPDGRADDPQRLLDPKVLARAAADATSQQVQLALPRWDTETKADLVDVLQRLGMKQAFEPGQYPELVEDPAFVISEVVQQANITVGEKGTEAAAATAIVGETSAAVPSGKPFVADHPFAFAIVHDQTGVPLFEGVVNDPSAG